MYRGSDIGSDNFMTLTKLRLQQNGYTFPLPLHENKIYFIIKLYYLMTKVSDGYVNKAFNRNCNTFQTNPSLFTQIKK
jgi:hypothetical protein